MNTELISFINQSLETNLPVSLSYEALHERLTAYIDHLITHNFEKLAYCLYRVDVEESRIRQLLEKKQGENASGLIANLIIERQLEKIKNRKDTKNKEDIPDNEEW